MYNTRRRSPGYGILLLAYQVFGVIGVKYIPPVTLAIVGLHSAIYLRLFQLPWYKVSQICVSSHAVWYKKDYKRLLYAAFEHGDDWHLYYNMVSFIVKGRTLERRFGSVKFLYLVFIFSILTNVVLVALNRLASEYIDDYYDTTCAIGFSGVIFALKVLTSYYEPNYSHQMMGIPILVPAHYAVWIELLLIQLMIPNVSFLGHLAGILVGLAYVKSPLGYFLNFIYSLFVTAPPPRFQPRAEPSGYSQPPQFHQYVPSGMNEDEQLRRATEASLNEERSRAYPPSFAMESDVDDIRRRRLQHYQ